MTAGEKVETDSPYLEKAPVGNERAVGPLDLEARGSDPRHDSARASGLREGYLAGTDEPAVAAELIVAPKAAPAPERVATRDRGQTEPRQAQAVGRNALADSSGSHAGDEKKKTYEESLTVTAPAPSVGTSAATDRNVTAQEALASPRGLANSLAATEADKIARLEQAKGASAPPSTGGAAEPNDQPVGDMFFRPAGTNPFVDTAEDRLSTFALDVDTGSYTLARSYLERGALPPVEAIRVEEFVNAQRYDDPAPRRGEFTLAAEGAPSPFVPVTSGDRYRLVRFAVKAREIYSRGAQERAVDLRGRRLRLDESGEPARPGATRARPDAR